MLILKLKFQMWVIMLISDGSVVCLFRIAKQAVRVGGGAWRKNEKSEETTPRFCYLKSEGGKNGTINRRRLARYLV